AAAREAARLKAETEAKRVAEEEAREELRLKAEAEAQRLAEEQRLVEEKAKAEAQKQRLAAEETRQEVEAKQAASQGDTNTLDELCQTCPTNRKLEKLRVQAKRKKNEIIKKAARAAEERNVEEILRLKTAFPAIGELESLLLQAALEKAALAADQAQPEVIEELQALCDVEKLQAWFEKARHHKNKVLEDAQKAAQEGQVRVVWDLIRGYPAIQELKALLVVAKQVARREIGRKAQIWLKKYRWRLLGLAFMLAIGAGTAVTLWILGNRGSIEVVTDPPGFQVLLDKKITSRRTPATFWLKPGVTHEIGVGSDGWSTNIPIVLKRGERTKVRITIPRGVVSVTTVPSGATILTNGVVTGQRTPATLEL
ncbi:MAG: hypothetical protein AABZ02_10830, partial [Bacteroidota bacterium]